MNIPIAIAASITLLAFFLHISGGAWESLQIKPSRVQSEHQSSLKIGVYDKIWTQSMCAFQMLSIDLLLLSIVLYLLAATDLILQRKEIALVCAIVFLLWGAVWLIQMVFLKRPTKEYLLLLQWLFWFVCSALVFLGSVSLG